MQKYGFYKNGKQRWLLNKEATARTSSQSRSTFYRKNRKLWLIEPNIPITGEVYQAIIIDAQFLSNKTAILIAVTPKFSVSYHWSKGGERTDEYEALLSKLPPSEYIICDGNKAILSVCKRI
ncbi:MAG: hypothetical protein FWF37_04195, partial [Chloroflexi bacterium]|nr:hypothetical protein [Chloroflexota bacterium]